MREKIERMYASGELEKILRSCKVREEDIPDLLQEVSLELLTSDKPIRHIGRYTFSIVRRQYFTKDGRSKWHKMYGEWEERRVGLQEARREVSDEG